MTSLRLKPFQLGAAALAIAVAGCPLGETEPEEEPAVTSMVLDIDQGAPLTATQFGGFGQQALVTETGSFLISSTQFLMAGGEADLRVNELDFRLEVAGNEAGGPLPQGVAFTRSGSFSGTVAGVQEGQTVELFFTLDHILRGHIDFGPHALPVTRPASGGGPPLQ